MAKTSLTIAIEDRLYHYRPDTTAGQRINKFRNSHIGYEVPVSSGTTADGLIDCVRIDEILVNGVRSHMCTVGHNKDWYLKNHPKVLDYIKCTKNYTDIESLPEYCEDTNCTGNCITNNYDNEICVTCYEIKISKEDFHSSHGHNFVGNANYYVMPDTLYKTVKSEISEDIGVIVYSVKGATESLRRVKESKYIPMDPETQRWLILNVMKKKLNYKDYNRILDLVKYFHQLLPRTCELCDFYDNTTVCDKISKCSVATNDEKHSCYWSCKNQELLDLGIYYEALQTTSHNQEVDIFE